jgi:hypothetical protein
MGTLEATQKKVDYVKIVKKAGQKKIDLIFTGLTFIGGTLLIVFAIVPTIKTVQSINKEIKQKQEISLALKNKYEALTSLDNQYKQYKDIFDDIELIFPDAQNFSLFLANIDAVVTRNNFVLESIGFSENKTKDVEVDTQELIPFSVRLSVKGKKVYIISLLKDLEAMPMFPVVESISYSEEVNDDGNTGYSLSIRIYGVEEINFYE